MFKCERLGEVRSFDRFDECRRFVLHEGEHAARDALKPTVTELQASAVDLVKRMCALTDAVETKAA